MRFTFPHGIPCSDGNLRWMCGVDISFRRSLFLPNTLAQYPGHPMTPTGMPQTSIFTRYLLENPWPVGIGLILLGVALLFLALNRDESRVLYAAIGAIGVAAIVLAIGWLVETTAERAADATRDFVRAAEEGRVHDMIATLHPDATLHLGRPGNPGQPVDELERDIRTLDSSNRIVSNSLNALAYGSRNSTSAITTFTCMTTTESSYGPVQSKWMLEWQMDDRGTWRIRRITAIEIAGRTPSGSALR